MKKQVISIQWSVFRGQSPIPTHPLTHLHTHTPQPRHPSPVTRHSSRAFSLIEILVAVALMSFIVLGLLTMFNQTSRVFRGGMAQVDIMVGGRVIMDIILREMEQISPSQ